MLLGCHCRGRAAKRGVLRRQGGRLSLQDTRRREGREWCFWQQPTHSCPKESRAGLMSSGWSLRKLLITWTHIDLIFFCSYSPLLPLFTGSASFNSPKILKNKMLCSSFNLSLQFSFILCATLSFMLTTASLSSLHSSEIQLLEWKPIECIWIAIGYHFPPWPWISSWGAVLADPGWSRTWNHSKFGQIPCRPARDISAVLWVAGETERQFRQKGVYVPHSVGPMTNRCLLNAVLWETKGQDESGF